MPARTTPQELFALPAKTLMDKFGAGTHAPGSGSAAAFSGILACRLILTVASLTRQKPKYARVKNQMEFVSEQIAAKHEPALYALFQRDAEVFNAVVTARIARNAAADEGTRKIFRLEALNHLRTATEIPLDIARHCLDVSRLALTTFDIGFQSARGDSGAAGSSALSGASSSLFVTYLNLQSFRDSAWARGVQQQCDELFGQFADINRQLFTRVTKLRREAIDAQKLPFDVDLPMILPPPNTRQTGAE